MTSFNLTFNLQGKVAVITGSSPEGLPAHRYIFTVHALGVPKLEMPANATNAVVRFFIGQNTLATASLTGLYPR